MTNRRRPPGRPHSSTPKVPTSVRIPTPIYDAICRQALRRGWSVHRLIQVAIAHYVTKCSQKTPSQS